MRKTLLSLFGIALVGGLLSRCGAGPGEEQMQKGDTLAYVNLHDSVGYVGKEVCGGCHTSIAQTFGHTGMGMSFGPATPEKSAGSFDGKKIIHDPHLNLSYRPFWKDEELFVEEFRMEGKDTIHRRIQKVDHIVGSGQHTNSHIFGVNGYLFQAPFTFYTQKGVLDLPPGFEDGHNSRFSRMIGLECMSCHNAMPLDFVAGSENKFDVVPNGIDCERCHGPGEAHVRKIGSGRLTDTSQAIDHSIVNPAKLDVELQFQICQRCHLQGNAVLKKGKSFLDFKPGMELKEIMDIYMPRYQNSKDAFIMASHVDRFKMSDCFKAGMGKFNCTSCHDPHVSVRETRIEGFNATCKKCHEGKGHPRFSCTVQESDFLSANGNCVSCHMPSSGSTDIPHVTVHDHFIRKPKTQSTTVEGGFIRLECINEKDPAITSRIRAYLQFYERFEAVPQALDSAEVLIEKASTRESLLFERVLFHFLKGEYSQIVKWVENQGIDNTLRSLDQKDLSNEDAWTAYRIAEAYRSFSDNENAKRFLSRAVELAPFNLDFIQKYGTVLSSSGDLDGAIRAFERVLKEYPLVPEAHNNLGYLQLSKGNLEKAGYHLQRAIQLDPDYAQAKINLASLAIAVQNWKEAESLLREILKEDPKNSKVRAALDYVIHQEKFTP